MQVSGRTRTPCSRSPSGRLPAPAGSNWARQTQVLSPPTSPSCGSDGDRGDADDGGSSRAHHAGRHRPRPGARSRLNTLTLTIATRTATSLGVDVPTGAASGTLTVVDTAGVARPLSQTITIAGAVAVSTFSPATIVTGQTLTVNGANLDRAVSIVFANGTAAPVASHAGTTRLTAIVPDAATSGCSASAVMSRTRRCRNPAAGDTADTRQRESRLSGRGSRGTVTMTGTGLTEVAGVRVARPATVVSKLGDATGVRGTRQPGLRCDHARVGVAAVGGGRQPGRRAGCVATVAGIEFAQVLSQGPSDARLRLVPARRPGCGPSSCRGRRMCRHRSFD